MSSNEGLFMAISQFLVDHWRTSGWVSWWMNGVPFENTYSPLLPIVDAVSAKAAHSSTALAFHRTLAFFYCLGPVCLFWFAWRMSNALYPSFLCGLVYSLTSPSVLFPAVRADVGGWLYARRLHTLVHYGEGAHNVALSLLPVAFLCAWLAMEQRRFRWYVATGAIAGVLLLTNAFAAVDLGLGIVCLLVIRPRGSRLRSLSMLALTAIIAYLWISPFLTPTLIQTIRMDSMLGVGYHVTTQRRAGGAAQCSALLTRRHGDGATRRVNFGRFESPRLPLTASPRPRCAASLGALRRSLVAQRFCWIQL